MPDGSVGAVAPRPPSARRDFVAVRGRGDESARSLHEAPPKPYTPRPYAPVTPRNVPAEAYFRAGAPLPVTPRDPPAERAAEEKIAGAAGEEAGGRPAAAEGGEQSAPAAASSGEPPARAEEPPKEAAGPGPAAAEQQGAGPRPAPPRREGGRDGQQRPIRAAKYMELRTFVPTLALRARPPSAPAYYSARRAASASAAPAKAPSPRKAKDEDEEEAAAASASAQQQAVLQTVSATQSASPAVAAAAAAVAAATASVTPAQFRRYVMSVPEGPEGPASARRRPASAGPIAGRAGAPPCRPAAPLGPELLLGAGLGLDPGLTYNVPLPTPPAPPPPAGHRRHRPAARVRPPRLGPPRVRPPASARPASARIAWTSAAAAGAAEGAPLAPASAEAPRPATAPPAHPSLVPKHFRKAYLRFRIGRPPPTPPPAGPPPRPHSLSLAVQASLALGFKWPGVAADPTFAGGIAYQRYKGAPVLDHPLLRDPSYQLWRKLNGNYELGMPPVNSTSRALHPTFPTDAYRSPAKKHGGQGYM
eukprot:tig00000073_g1692.t1